MGVVVALWWQNFRSVDNVAFEFLEALSVGAAVARVRAMRVSTTALW